MPSGYTECRQARLEAETGWMPARSDKQPDNGKTYKVLRSWILLIYSQVRSPGASQILAWDLRSVKTALRLYALSATDRLPTLTPI